MTVYNGEVLTNDALWSIALHCSDEQVSKKAADMITGLFDKVPFILFFLNCNFTQVSPVVSLDEIQRVCVENCLKCDENAEKEPNSAIRAIDILDVL